MTITFGRCSLPGDPFNATVNGDQVTFGFHILPAVANDVASMKALRQQLYGLINNVDEPIVPITWSLDSSFDGFYAPQSVSLPADVALRATTTGRLVQCSISFRRVIGYANPRCEVTTDSVLITNDHSLTVPPAVIAATLPSPNISEVDLRPSLTGATAISRTADNGSVVTAYTLATPVSTTRYRFPVTPALFYTGACKIEYSLDAGSTWYVAVGRDIPRATMWRIGNGLIRLTSADGTNAGTLEVWDTAYESRSICHVTNGSTGPGIGGGSTATSSGATLSILQNAPECCIVRVVGNNLDWTYKMNRGERHFTADWTCTTATKFGIGYSATVACTSITGGLVTTSNDANGNKLVFSLPVAQTKDTTNGRTNAATATTSGTVMAGVVLAGSSAISGDAAADLINQYIGAVTSAQQVVTV